mgnify:CR=1 FL=1
MESNTITALLLEAATLLGVGMSMVFIFLSILVVSVKLMTKIVLAFPDNSQLVSPSAPPKAPAPAVNDEQTITAIKAAVSAYRSGNVSQ